MDSKTFQVFYLLYDWWTKIFVMFKITYIYYGWFYIVIELHFSKKVCWKNLIPRSSYSRIYNPYIFLSIAVPVSPFLLIQIADKLFMTEYNRKKVCKMVILKFELEKIYALSFGGTTFFIFILRGPKQSRTKMRGQIKK